MKFDSPFNPATPLSLTVRELFVDRQAELDQARQIIGTPGTVLAISGTPGIGKTSFAMVLLDAVTRESGAKTVRVNATWDITVVVRNLISHLVEITEAREGWPVFPVQHGSPDDQIEYLIRCFGHVARFHHGLRLLICIDDFDSMENARPFAHLLKVVADRNLGDLAVSFILVGRDFAAFIRQSPFLFRSLQTLHLGSLSAQDIEQFFRQAVEFYRLPWRFDEDSIREAHRLTHGIPYFIHLVGAELNSMRTNTDRPWGVRREDIRTAFARIEAAHPSLYRLEEAIDNQGKLEIVRLLANAPNLSLRKDRLAQLLESGFRFERNVRELEEAGVVHRSEGDVVLQDSLSGALIAHRLKATMDFRSLGR